MADIDTLTALRAEVRGLKQALEDEKQLHAFAKAFHDVAVSQRNAAWAENERLKEELTKKQEAFRQNMQPDWSR